MPKIQLEVEVSKEEAQAKLEQFRAQMGNLGGTAQVVSDDLDRKGASLARLTDRLGVTEDATGKLKKQEEQLKWGLESGRITADQYEQGLRKLHDQKQQGQSVTDKLAGSVRGLINQYGGFVSAGAVVGFLKSSVEAAIEAEQSHAKLVAVLAATSGVAGVTAESVEAYASKMQGLTGVEDDTITSAAAVLATFKGVKAEGFDRTMTAAMDLSAVMGQDLQSSVTMLGKALENPAKGLTALTRVGVTFTDQEKATIKDLQEHNRLAEAQTLILKAVETQVGGTATALGQTLGGQLSILKAAFGDLQEGIGGAVVKLLNLGDVAKTWTGWLKEWNDSQQESTAASQLTAKALENEATLLRGKTTALQDDLKATQQGSPERAKLLEQLMQSKQRLADVERALGDKTKEEKKAAIAAKAGAEAEEEKGKATKLSNEKLEEQLEALEHMRSMVPGVSYAIRSLEVVQAEAAAKAKAMADENARVLAVLLKLQPELKTLQLLEVDPKIIQVTLDRAKLQAEKTYIDKVLPASRDYLVKAILDTGSVDSARDMLLDKLPEKYQPLVKPILDGVATGQAVAELLAKLPPEYQVAIETALNQAQAQADAIWLKGYWQGVAKDIGAIFGAGIAEGTLDLFQGKDLSKAWEDTWQGLATIAAEKMSSTISQGLFGGDGPMGQGVDGIFEGGWSKWSTGQRWQFAGQTVGAGLMAYGQAKQNNTATVAGGMVSGAASGAMMTAGPYAWVGAIIGAVAGGALAYFGSKGDQRYKYSIGYGAGLTDPYHNYVGPAGTYVRAEGMGADERAELGREMLDKVMAYRLQFKEIGKLLDVDAAGIDFMKQGVVPIQASGETGNFAQVWQTFLQGTLPREMWKTGVGSAIAGGLKGAGVSDERIKAEFAQLDTGRFDTGLAQIRAWIGSIIDLRDVGADLGKSSSELRAEVSKTLRESFLDGFSDVMDKAKDLTEGVDKLFSQEQVANAQQLVELGKQQYQDGLSYYRELEQARVSYQQTTEDIFAGFAETRAKEHGAASQASFYKQQLSDLEGQLEGASSKEQLDRIMGKIFSYGQSLWGLDMGEGDFRYRDEAQQAIAGAQYKADLKVKEWEDEVAAKNAALKAEMDLMSAALKGASTAAGASAGAQDENTGATEGNTTATDTNTEAMYRATQAAEAFTAAMLQAAAVVRAGAASATAGGDASSLYVRTSQLMQSMTQAVV